MLSIYDFNNNSGNDIFEFMLVRNFKNKVLILVQEILDMENIYCRLPKEEIKVTISCFSCNIDSKYNKEV